MAIITLRFMAMVILVITCTLTFDNTKFMAYGQCEGDIPSLITECAQYVRKEGPKSRPSSACCGVAKKANVPCLCKYVTKDIEKYVSIEKVVYVAQTCGVHLQHGAKCGSYTIP